MQWYIFFFWYWNQTGTGIEKKSLFQWWFQVILNGTKNNNGLDLCTLSKISSAYKQNKLIYFKLFNFRLFCSVVFHWPCGKIYCKNSFFQFVRGKIRKFDIKVEKWEGWTVCKRNMASPIIIIIIVVVVIISIIIMRRLNSVQT